MTKTFDDLTVVPPKSIPSGSGDNATDEAKGWARDELETLDNELEGKAKTHVNRLFLWTLWTVWGLLAILGLLWFINFLSPPWNCIQFMLWLTPEQMEKIQYLFTGIIGTKVIQSYLGRF